MAIRILVISALIALSACVSDQQFCGGDWDCVANRQAQRNRLTDMMVYQNTNRQPALFYAMPPIASGNAGSVRLQTTCSRLGAYTYCN